MSSIHLIRRCLFAAFTAHLHVELCRPRRRSSLPPSTVPTTVEATDPLLILKVTISAEKKAGGSTPVGERPNVVHAVKVVVEAHGVLPSNSSLHALLLPVLGKLPDDAPEEFRKVFTAIGEAELKAQFCGYPTIFPIYLSYAPHTKHIFYKKYHWYYFDVANAHLDGNNSFGLHQNTS